MENTQPFNQKLLLAATFITGGALIGRAITTLQSQGMSYKELMDWAGFTRHSTVASQFIGGSLLAFGSTFTYLRSGNGKEVPIKLPPQQLTIGELELEQPHALVGTIEELSKDYARVKFGSTLVEVKIQDIVEAGTDAIVNAANGGLQLGGGVAGAIAKKDSGDNIQRECNTYISKKGPLKDGEAMATCGWHEGPTWVIHAVGPIYSTSHHATCVKSLHNAYVAAFKKGEELKATSIAIPFLSSNIFGYTTDKGSHLVALRALQDFVTQEEPTHLKEIRFVSLDRDKKVRRDFIVAIDEYCINNLLGEIDTGLFTE